MTSKGVLKAEIIIQSPEFYSKVRADKLYFKKLDASDNFSNGKIIYSDVRDGDFVMINCDPGTYVVIAASMIEGMDHMVVCFNEDVMNYTKVEVKAGDTVELKGVYVDKNTANFFGSVSELQTHHRKIIGKQLAMVGVQFRLGELNKSLNKNLKKVIDKPVTDTDDQVIEEYKQ